MELKRHKDFLNESNDDSVTLVVNQRVEVKVFLDESGDEFEIDVYEKGETLDVDILGEDDHNYNVQFPEGSVAFIPKSAVTKK